VPGGPAARRRVARGTARQADACRWHRSDRRVRAGPGAGARGADWPDAVARARRATARSGGGPQGARSTCEKTLGYGRASRHSEPARVESESGTAHPSWSSRCRSSGCSRLESCALSTSPRERRGRGECPDAAPHGPGVRQATACRDCHGEPLECRGLRGQRLGPRPGAGSFGAWRDSGPSRAASRPRSWRRVG
jgi:hypothetical protein